MSNAITSQLSSGGILTVTVDAPPVNALTAEQWFSLARELDRAHTERNIRVVVLRAEGRGFNAGVDIKEIQAATDNSALLAVNRGCFEAFRSTYECPVPVIVAVHGYCLGGGVGLVGNADIVVASDDAYLALPEVDRGALGAATHLSRLVPTHLMRPLYYTGMKITAQELHRLGSILTVTTRDELDAAAQSLAAQIADKHPDVIRAAKEALNGIDLMDVNRSYRLEQGFTFELSLRGAGDELRESFLREDRNR